MIKPIVFDKKELSKKCTPADLESKETLDITEDLLDTAKHLKFNCAGLAANQIGHDKRIIIIKIKNKFVVMVNPEYITKSKAFRFDNESCLSFPGVTTKKRRHQTIKISYFCPIKNKQIKSKKLKNLEARIFQHEMDHLEGALI